MLLNRVESKKKVSAAVRGGTWHLFWMLVVSLWVANPASAAIKVVATLPTLAAVAREVGGKNVEVSALAQSTEDPHYVDARPNLIVKLNQADLLIINGLELEVGWLPTLQSSARNAKILSGGTGFLDASRVVHLMDVPTGKVDRAMGDLHPGGNPHFLFDPRAVAQVAVAVGDKLAELDGPNAATYKANAAALSKSLLTLAGEQIARFTALPPAKRNVVSYHKSLIYLTNWLNLNELATVEPKPGVPPDPGHVASVLKTMRGSGAKVILQEEFYPSNTSQTIVKLLPGSVVSIHGGVRFDQNETVATHLKALADEVYNALSR